MTSTRRSPTTDGSSTPTATPPSASRSSPTAGFFVVTNDFIGDILRYEADGTPDTSFSDDGRQTTDFVGRWNAASDLAIQPDGRIFAVGLTAIPDEDSFGSHFAVARYNANGSLDETFDDEGRQTTRFVDGSQEARGVAIEPDGGIVVAGRAWPNVGNASMAIGRYDEEGALDETFDDGKQLATPSAADSADAEDVVLQADGGIVLAGRRTKRRRRGTPHAGAPRF